jgi:hypothetical protein
MSLTLKIAGATVPFDESTLSLIRKVDERNRLQVTVLDYLGVYVWQFRTSVVLIDNGTGVTLFNGFLIEDKQNKQNGFPSTLIEHEIDTVDAVTLPGKRTYTRTYTNPAYAGKIVIDHLNDVLSQENIAQNYALSYDSTVTDFAQGILTNTQGAATIGTGDLELATQGSNLTITENTTAQFATGTLTNVTAVSNTLIPTSTTAIYCSATLGGTLAGSFMAVKIWGGSMTVGTSDTLNYDIWIAGTSPSDIVGLDLYFSDGTKMSGYSTSDQNGLSGSPLTDLSAFALNMWYTRNIALGSALNAQVITSVAIVVAGTSVGTYTAYIKNAYLGSQTGNKFFGIGATVTNVNPPQILQYAGYSITNVFSAVVSVFIASNASRVSTAYSIDAVKLLKSSVISWSSFPVTGTLVSASYDGGASYAVCTNNAALPALPAGTNVTGLSITLKEAFVAGGSTDPTIFPTFSNLSIALTSAPSATKSDIVQSYITSTNWNTGTYTNTVLSGNNLTLGSLSRNWNDNLITNQTFFAPSGVSQAASSGVYSITTGTGGTQTYGQSRLDLAGQLVDFILDIDMQASNSVSGSGIITTSYAGVTYRQISWQATTDNAFGYLVDFIPAYSSSGVLGQTLRLGYGSNGTTNAYTLLSSVSETISVGTYYHVKIVVKGSRHQVYWNNGGTPAIDVIDSTYPQIGGFGLRQFNVEGTTGINGAITTKYDNLVVQPIEAGSWQSSAISISSLTTCGSSAIYWTATGTSNPAISSIVVQSSIDSGSTFQICTNGAPIPNLTPGMTVTGKTIIMLVTINSISVSYLPVLSQMVWRVLGAYPGSSGTRTTSPLGNDMSITRTVGSGWGTAFDSQSWVQVGTGTTAVGSGEATIANTAGDVHMVLGSRTWTDEDGTCRFSLSASTISAGIELRYVNSSNFYRLQASTTAVSIVKRLAGVTTTLATVSMAIPTATFYRMRFRIVGTSPVLLWGNVWLDGTGENYSTWTILGSD